MRHGLLTKRMKVVVITAFVGLVVGICLLGSFSAGAAGGSLDPTFDPGVGPNKTIRAMVLQPDGKIIIAGDFNSYAGTGRNGVARLNADGTLDTSFDPGSGADPMPPANCNALALQPDGKILLGGNFQHFNGSTRFGLVRLNPNGSVDTGFNPVLGSSTGVAAIVLQPDGKVIVGGLIDTLNNTLAHNLARLNTDGTQDTSFTTSQGADNSVLTAAVQSDGRIIIGGSFTHYGSTTRNRTARLNSDGSLDSSFDPGAGSDGTVDAIAVQSDNRILIGGFFSNFNGASHPGIVRLNTNGSLDNSFSAAVSGSAVVSALMLLPGDQILIGGNSLPNSTAVFSVVCLNTNGTLSATALTVPGDVGTSVNALVYQPDNKFVLAGNFTSYNGTTRNRLARVVPDPGTVSFSASAYSVGEAAGVANLTVTRTGFAPLTAKVNQTSGTTLIVPANSDSYNIGAGADGTVRTSALQPDGHLIIGGDFTSYDTVSRSKITRLNADGSLDSAFHPGTGADNTINATAVQPDGKVIIGGDFTNFDLSARTRIARLNANGSLDSSFNPGSGTNASVRALAVQPDGRILVAGTFITYNGTSRSRIARLNSDGSLDTSFNPGTGANSGVQAMVLQPDGKIIIAGVFSVYNGTSRIRVARLKTDGSLDTSFDPGAGPNNLVQIMALQADGKVIIGGSFTSDVGQPRRGIARLNSDGSLDPSFNPGNGADNPAHNSMVRAIALQPDGQIIIGGDFVSYNNNVRNRVARLNTDGSVDTAFDPGSGADNTVQTIVCQSDGRFVLGGDFLNYKGVARNRIARITGDLFVYWPAGDTTNRTVSIPIPNDTVHSGNHIATFSLNPLTAGATTGAIPTTTLTIVDDDKFADQLSSISGNGVAGGPLVVTATLNDLSNAQPMTNRTVSFSINGISLGSALTNSQGVATISTSTPASVTNGIYANGISVSFAGETDYAAANGIGPAVILSQSDLTLTSVSAVSGAAPYLGQATVSATLSSNGVPLSGKTISFTLSAVSVGQANTNASGVATLNNVAVAGGTNAGTYPAAVGASFAGDITYAASSASGSLVISKANQAINFPKPTDKVFGGPPFALSGTATSGLPLTFEVVSGPAVLNGAILTLTDLGSVTVRARQDGDGNFNAATPVEQTFTIQSATGSLDPTLDPDVGPNDAIWTVITQPDSKIIIAGDFTSYEGTARNRVARLNTDGSLDTSFDPGTGANGLVVSSALLPDGKILIGGAFGAYNGVNRGGIARLNLDGSLDSSFDPGTGLSPPVISSIHTIAVQADGKILIGGGFIGYNGTSLNSLARLNPDGSLDTSFVPPAGVDMVVEAIVAQSDGRIIVGGNSRTQPTVATSDLVRLNPNGSLDTSFTASQIDGPVTALALQPDGQILVGGFFTKGIMRFKPDGSQDTSFIANTSQVRSILRQPDGKLVMIGPLFTVNGLTRRRVARLNPDGSVDTTLDIGAGVTGGTEQTFGLAIDRQGRIIVSGHFEAFNGLPRHNLVRLLPAAGKIQFNATEYAVGEWENSANIVLSRTGGTDNQVVARLTLTDMTTTPDDFQLSQGALDQSFDPGQGPTGTVLTSALQPDGRLIIGGNFSAYKSAARSNLARVYPDGSLDDSFNPGTGLNGMVWASLLQPDGRLLVGGGFTSYNGTARKRIVRVNDDGSLDTTFNPTGGGADQNNVLALGLQAFDKVMIGGDFTSYNSTARNRIARLNSDGSLDASFNPGSGANAKVEAISVQPDHKTIIAGDFTTYNGTARSRIARLNYDGSLDTSFAPGSGANSEIRGIVLQPDGRIIIGGGFNTYNGTARLNFARLNANGTLDTSFDPGTGADGPLFTLALQTDGRVILGGGLGQYNGVMRKGLARVNGDLFLVWAPGDASDKTLTIPIVDDHQHEPIQETLDLTISEVTGMATIGDPSDVVLTIFDNDPADSSLSSVSGSGVAGGPLTLTATLISDGAALSGKTVNFNLFGNSAGPAVTDGNGVATLSTAAIPGLAAGNYANVVSVSFAGDTNHSAASASGPLAVAAQSAPPPATFSGVSGTA